MVVRRNYKDSLFRHLFGSTERKAEALELYNALAGTAHDNPDEIEITTIDNFIFLGRKNDVSFLIESEMVLLEHQSTKNPNMPLRGLLYFSRLYAKLIEERGLDLYGKGLIELPTPRYFVLYFGEEDRPDREVLTLASAFPSGPGDLEVTATVLNCNEGRNRAIMAASETLRGYAHLLALARGFAKGGMPLEDAVERAVARCIDEGCLSGYLSAHRMEVQEMLFTIEDEERALRVHREAIAREATEEGLAKGMAEGMAEGLEQGRREEADRIAANLRAMGLSEAQIEQALADAS